MPGKKRPPAVAAGAVHTVAEANDDHFGLERFVFFSDAVFAIAITLLALEIRLPESEAFLSNDRLLQALLSLWPKYLSFVLSFVVVGLFWMTHHRKYRFIRRYDGVLLWLNLLLMMCIAFLPFPTAVLSEYGNRTATIFYALTISVTGLVSWSTWWYASAGHRLIDPGFSDGDSRWERIRPLITPVVFLISVPVAFVNDEIAKYFWALAIVANFVYRRAKLPNR